MGAWLLAAGLGLIALPGLCAPLGRRLGAGEWARLCQIALIAGAVLVEVACVLYAAPTVLRAAGAPALARMCERALRTLLPGAAWAGWLAAAGALTIAASSGLGVLRARRGAVGARIEPWLGEHRGFDGYDLVTLPTDRAIALSVTGTPSQIVVSRGLVESLTPPQLELVVRHEAAHLDLRHQRILRRAVAIDHGFAFFPPARRSTGVLRTALERWADEVAAGDQPAERSTLRSALLGVVALAVGAELAAFAAADTISERLEALARSRPSPSRSARASTYAPGLSLAAVVVAAVAASGGQAYMVISMVGHCL